MQNSCLTLQNSAKLCKTPILFFGIRETLSDVASRRGVVCKTFAKLGGKNKDAHGRFEGGRKGGRCTEKNAVLQKFCSKKKQKTKLSFFLPFSFPCKFYTCEVVLQNFKMIKPFLSFARFCRVLQKFCTKF